MLDSAVFRRFDSVIHYALPEPEVAKWVICNRLAAFTLGHLSWVGVFEACEGLSHSEIAVAAETAAKKVVLSGREQITTAGIVAARLDRSRQAPDTDQG